jgi:two-component system alkaline phosphatase synthesis response regulator PhoP
MTKILIVDDIEDARDMLAKLLELDNFTVITAEDGLAGLRKAESELPSLIITDINMPNLNGIEMIKRLREIPELSDTPIMAVTAYGEDTAEFAVEAGADFAMTKPLEFRSLIDGVHSLLSRKSHIIH